MRTPGDVILHAPSFAFQAPGGGENQLIQTGRHLEELGVPVRLFSAWTDRLEDARLLHLFGMSREGLELARVAKARAIPVVLSPICWYEPHAMASLEPTLFRKAVSVAGWVVRSIAPLNSELAIKLLRLADLVLPNSRSEANQLKRLFGVDSPVASAWCPTEFFRDRSGRPVRRSFALRIGEFPFVLSVGRIEPRKNTLEL